MTKFGNWIRRQWNGASFGTSGRLSNLANLAALLEEELDKRRNPGNPHLRESDHAGDGGCPQDCLDFQAAFAACKKFMERYD